MSYINCYFSFAYVRVKGTRNAQKVVKALHNLKWRGHTISAKMPGQAAVPPETSNESSEHKAKREMLLRSSFEALQRTSMRQRLKEKEEEDENDTDTRGERFTFNVVCSRCGEKLSAAIVCANKFHDQSSVNF